MPAIVYDTGALLAAERRNPDFLALPDELTSARIRPTEHAGDPVPDCLADRRPGRTDPHG